MTPQRARTVKYLAIFLGFQFLALLGLLAIELNAVHQGGESTISEVLWQLWATQPWIVLVVSHTIAGPAWFLCGHFFAAPRGHYDEIRRRSRSAGHVEGWAVAVALALAALPASAQELINQRGAAGRTLAADGRSRAAVPQLDAADPAPTIRAAIDDAVQQTLDAAAAGTAADQAVRIAALEAKLKRVEEVADITSSCVRAAFVYAGADLVSTSAALKWCPACQEANPAGFNVEARVGLKLGLLGANIDQCYRAAKKGKKEASFLTWAIRLVQGFAVVNNTYSAVAGKPLVNWGAPDHTLEAGR